MYSVTSMLSMALQPALTTGYAIGTIVKGKKVKERIALNGTPSHSYGVSLAIWDHTVLPTTRHK